MEYPSVLPACLGDVEPAREMLARTMLQGGANPSPPAAMTLLPAGIAAWTANNSCPCSPPVPEQGLPWERDPAKVYLIQHEWLGWKPAAQNSLFIYAPANAFCARDSCDSPGQECVCGKSLVQPGSH